MKAKKTKRPRPNMPPASEEMKQWSAMLGNELTTWPKVTTRPMFGLRGFYRGKKIFAALPVTRAIKNPRIETESAIPSAKWFVFELNSEADFRDALWWINQAYERAK